MAYTKRIEIEDGVGSQGYAFNEFDLNLSQVISGSPQYYAGSIIQFQEIIRLTFVIDEPSLVDVDYRWFDPKLYLASYQVSGGLSGLFDGYNDDGHCNYERTFLKYYSYYTVGGDAAVPIGLSTQNDIVNCNFFLQPEVYLFPGENTPVTGFKTHEGKPSFIATNTIACAPLQDTKFSQKARSIGVHSFAGVRLQEIFYIATDINKIETSYPPYSSPTCEFAGTQSCTSQFNAFLLSNPAYFRDLASCEAVSNADSPCTEKQFVCPSDPTQIFTYYEIISA